MTGKTPTWASASLIVSYLMDEIGLDDLQATRHGAALARLVQNQLTAEQKAETKILRAELEKQRTGLMLEEARSAALLECVRWYAICDHWDEGERAIKTIGPQRRDGA